MLIFPDLANFLIYNTDERGDQVPGKKNLAIPQKSPQDSTFDMEFHVLWV